MRRYPIVLLLLVLSAAPAGARSACDCDCDGNGRVAVNDLIRLTSASLNGGNLCPSFLGGPVRIQVLVSCVGAALSRLTCTSESPTPTRTQLVPATPSPTDTPVLPPNPPADAEAAVLAAEVLQSITYVCATGITPGGRFEISSTSSGAHFLCDSFTGHNGSFDLVKHPSAAIARDSFGAVQPGESEINAGGGTFRESRSAGGCCPERFLQSSWRWQRDCWLARGHTFDDTHYILTPQGGHVVDALVESGRLDELLALCPAP